MSGLRNFISGIGLVILGSICAFTFMITFLATNNTDNIVANDPFVNSTLQSFKDSADNLQNIGENSKDLLAAEQPSAVYVFLIILSAFTIPLSFLGFLISGLNAIVTAVFTVIFGSGTTNYFFVSRVVTAIILISIVLLILRAIRTGETER